jgi:polyisoprenoid-binding protein YceI
MVWELDKSHSEVAFSVKHMMIATVKGKFKSFDATVELDPQAIEKSRVEATIDVASIDTHEDKRDGHLRSADFFDAENHPKMTFKSTKVTRRGEDIEVVGDLTIRGTTKPVTLKGTFEGPAKDPWGGQRFGFSLDGAVEREDFGLQWNVALETGGVLVGKTVKIHLEGQLVAK